jgi:hypothetical protein
VPVILHRGLRQARVCFFVRANGRCPARDFLEDCQEGFRRKFDGSFDTLLRMGADYHNDYRFKALTGAGKPLWEFKEHDHRIYCRRTVRGAEVEVVLLGGWVKDKTKGKRENAEIEKAMNLLNELNSERNE